MNTITTEKKWSGENLTNWTGGDGPADTHTQVDHTQIN